MSSEKTTPTRISAKEYIRIRGAREHNLKNIDVNIPRDKFVVLTGLSGSGKSSLAFDTIYAEGQRRYMESISSYARQFLWLTEMEIGNIKERHKDHLWQGWYWMVLNKSTVSKYGDGPNLSSLRTIPFSKISNK